MTYDCIIIGGGIGGLTSAAFLARSGAKVLLCHRFDHLGGTATEFRRGNFSFPAGPLSFSFHNYVMRTLSQLGIQEKINFRQSHFQHKCPEIDLVISRPFSELIEGISSFYPLEREGIKSFFSILKKLSERNYRKIEKSAGTFMNHKEAEKTNYDFKMLNDYERLSANELAGKFIKNRLLKVLLSSQSFEEGEMSASLCANMWDMMCEKGIWYPEEGFGKINKLLEETILNNSGEIRLCVPVNNIVIKNSMADGVILENGEFISSRFVISNTDYKNTFLKMASGDFFDEKFFKWVEGLHDSGSIFCVYLGVDSSKVDLTSIRAEHLFYRASMGSSSPWRYDIESEDFFLEREFEICRWSKKNEKSAPAGKETVILRTNAPYSFFKKWKNKEKEYERLTEYYEFKKKASGLFIKAGGHLLEGLEDSIETVDASTPLTYQKWSGSSEGACAGWSWDKDDKMGSHFGKLYKTPVENIYIAGCQAFSQLFMGGFATAMHSGKVIAEEILKETVC